MQNKSSFTSLGDVMYDRRIRRRTFSSLTGPTKELAVSYKDAELRHFSKLQSFCEDKGLVLDQMLVERGKLLFLGVGWCELL